MKLSRTGLQLWAAYLLAISLVMLIWKPYMVEDRNLVTGQNPASAAVLAKRLLEVLESGGPRVRSASERRAPEAGASPPH